MKIGCEKRAGERVWVGEPPHTRLTAPGRAGHSGFFRGVQFGKIRCQFCGPDARNGADCAVFARNKAKDSGARIGATSSESKNCGS